MYGTRVCKHRRKGGRASTGFAKIRHAANKSLSFRSRTARYGAFLPRNKLFRSFFASCFAPLFGRARAAENEIFLLCFLSFAPCHTERNIDINVKKAPSGAFFDKIAIHKKISCGDNNNRARKCELN